MVDNLSFELVTGSPSQVSILYTLLKNRVHSISHQRLPSYQDHEEFVKKSVYKQWFIIYEKVMVIGAFYIKYDNSIGLNLINNEKNIVANVLDFIRTNLTPSKASASEISSDFFINVASSNFELQNVLEQLNIKSIQISYKL